VIVQYCTSLGQPSTLHGIFYADVVKGQAAITARPFEIGKRMLAHGESLTIVKPSQHTLTAIDIAKRFTNKRIDLTTHDSGEHLLTVGKGEVAKAIVVQFTRPRHLRSSKAPSPP